MFLYVEVSSGLGMHTQHEVRTKNGEWHRDLTVYDAIQEHVEILSLRQNRFRPTLVSAHMNGDPFKQVQFSVEGIRLVGGDIIRMTIGQVGYHLPSKEMITALEYKEITNKRGRHLVGVRPEWVELLVADVDGKFEEVGVGCNWTSRLELWQNIASRLYGLAQE